MKPYAYHVFHPPTGMNYYGIQFNQKANPSDLWTRYFTSSKRVKKLIKLWGKKSFVVSIRKIFETPEAAVRWENRFLEKIDAKNNPKWLNTHNGDYQYINKGGYNLTEEQRDRRKGKAPWNKGKKTPPEIVAKSVAKRIGKPTWNKGIPRPEHLKAQHSKAMKGRNNPMFGKSAVKGRKWYTNGIDNVYVFPEEIPKGYVPGRIYSRK